MKNATVDMVFAIIGGALQLMDGGKNVLQRLIDLQAARTAAGVELTLEDLNVEFDESELAAIANWAQVNAAQKAKDASKAPV